MTALSRFLSRELAPALGVRPEVVPAGFEPAAARAPRRRPYVLSLARLQPYKGTDVLLMAWRDVCDRVPGVDLVLCGPDHGRGRYQELAARLGLSDRVAFTGARGRASVWGLLRGARAVVLASRREAFGLAAVEAMACGRAVLATRSGGPEETLRHGRTGLLVPPGRVEPLRDGLLRLLADARLRESLGRAARSAAAPYGWDAVAARYLRRL